MSTNLAAQKNHLQCAIPVPDCSSRNIAKPPFSSNPLTVLSLDPRHTEQLSNLQTSCLFVSPLRGSSTDFCVYPAMQRVVIDCCWLDEALVEIVPPKHLHYFAPLVTMLTHVLALLLLPPTSTLLAKNPKMWITENMVWINQNQHCAAELCHAPHRTRRLLGFPLIRPLNDSNLYHATV